MVWQVIARQLLGHALESGSRSTVVKSLQGVMVVLAIALVGATYVNAAERVVDALLWMLAIDFALFVAAYIYFGISDKDALRSETYSLRKMVIERGLRGDDLTGIFDTTKETTKTPQVYVDAGDELSGPGEQTQIEGPR